MSGFNFVDWRFFLLVSRWPSTVISEGRKFVTLLAVRSGKELRYPADIARRNVDSEMHPKAP